MDGPNLILNPPLSELVNLRNRKAERSPGCDWREVTVQVSMKLPVHRLVRHFHECAIAIRISVS